MPSFDGGDSLSPTYAPWAWIGPNNEHFVWQTARKVAHEGFLYRAGLVNGEQVVCERSPLEDANARPSMIRDRVELVPVEEIPQGLFPSLESMIDRLQEVQTMLNQVEPNTSSADQLGADITRR